MSASQAGDPPPVGGVAEEALKLVEALSSWSASSSSSSSSSGTHGHDHDADDARVAGESPECAWCPVCRALRVVRATPPEVREHLTSAASSLVQALAALLAPPEHAVRPDQGSLREPDDGEEQP